MPGGLTKTANKDSPPALPKEDELLQRLGFFAMMLAMFARVDALPAADGGCTACGKGNNCCGEGGSWVGSCPALHSWEEGNTACKKLLSDGSDAGVGSKGGGWVPNGNGCRWAGDVLCGGTRSSPDDPMPDGDAPAGQQKQQQQQSLSPYEMEMQNHKDEGAAVAQIFDDGDKADAAAKDAEPGGTA